MKNPALQRKNLYNKNEVEHSHKNPIASKGAVKMSEQFKIDKIAKTMKEAGALQTAIAKFLLFPSILPQRFTCSQYRPM